MGFIIDEKKCVGCGYCELLCHFDAISEEKLGIYHIAPEKCVGCGECADGCIARAIDAEPDFKRIDKVLIDKDLCKGCMICVKGCPVGAITGVLKQVVEIDESKCIKCGLCSTKCRLKAIILK